MTVAFASRPMTTQELERIFACMSNKYGIIVSTDLAVTPSAGLTVAIAASTAGSPRVNDTVLSTAVSGTTKTHAAAHASLNRRDYVFVDSAGTVDIKQGTAAAVPYLPDLDSDEMALAEVYIAANATVINSSDITDKRHLTPPNTWEHIDTQVLTGTATSISFQSISTAYKQFRVTLHLLASGTADVRMRLNNDSGNNYDLNRATINFGAAVAESATAQWIIAQFSNTGLIESHAGIVFVSKPTSGEEAIGHGHMGKATNAGNVYAYETFLGWRNVADLISRIDVLISAGNLESGSRITLEGLRIPA